MTWPTRTTAIPSPFASSIRRSADSRTWPTLPAAPSSSSTVAVWIESTMTAAWPLAIAPARRSARRRSPRRRGRARPPAPRAAPAGRPAAAPGRPIPRPWRRGRIGRRSRRARRRPGGGASTCRCRARRRPGRASPGTSPPPRTRSSSPIAVAAGAGRRPRRRAASGTALARRSRQRARSRAPPWARGRAVSTRLFQVPQVRHWPSQRRNDSPQVCRRSGSVATPRPQTLGTTSTGVFVSASAAWMSRPASGSLSTTIVVPGSYLPRSRCSARTSSIMFWITRRSGRAPYAES